MKKAKLMLTVIAVFAIVGGAMAIKANRGQFRIYYGTTTAACPYTTTATLNVNGAFLKSTYATTIPGATCALRPIYLAQ